MEYSKAALEAQLKEKQRIESYHKFYEDLTKKQLEKVEHFQKYLEHENPRNSPLLTNQRSMVAPWEASNWDSEKWRREQIKTNHMLSHQV